MATAAAVQLDAPRRGIEALLARHPLVFYFIIAYAFSCSRRCPWCFPKMVLASYRIVVR
jgi:hypothetical protein